MNKQTKKKRKEREREREMIVVGKKFQTLPQNPFVD
jgi:hypothetical protein